MNRIAWTGVLVAGMVSGVASAQEWKTSISLGGSMTDGNTETMTINAGVTSEKTWENSSLRLGLDGTYGEVSSAKTNEQAKASASYRHTISGRAYGLWDETLTHDDIADISYRLISSPGLGYYAMKDAAVTLGLEIGPSYIVEEVGGTEDDYAAIRFAERYDRKLSETAKCWQAAEYLPKIDDFEDYLLNAEIGVEAQVNATASIRIVVKDAYDSTPAADREENDLSVVASLVYTL